MNYYLDYKTDVKNIKKFNFFIPIPPRTYQTQKTRFGKGRCFKPKEVKDFEESIKMCALSALSSEFPLIDHIYYLEIDIIKKKPKNWFPKKQLLVGDIVNYMKTLEDALEGVLFENDKYIIRENVIKRYGDESGYRIRGFAYPIPEKQKKRRNK